MNIKPYMLFVFFMTVPLCVSVAEQSAASQKSSLERCVALNEASAERCVALNKASTERCTKINKASTERCTALNKASSKQSTASQKANADVCTVSQKANAKACEVSQKANAKACESSQKANAKACEASQKENSERYATSQKVLSKQMATWIKEWSEKTLTKVEVKTDTIATNLLEFSEQIDQTVTSCGSKPWQRLSLQAVEVPQATLARYSFNAACQNHDACYSDCRIDKPECDNKLLEDAKKVCESALMKESCNSSARIFYRFVSGMGDSFFNKARANCTKM